MIIHTYFCFMKKKETCPVVGGTTNLGERGQVVIPKEVRDQLNLKSGETFFVMVHNGAIVFLPKKQMEQFIKKLTSTFSI